MAAVKHAGARIHPDTRVEFDSRRGTQIIYGRGREMGDRNSEIFQYLKDKEAVEVEIAALEFPEIFQDDK